jgi:hypothetical protein
MRTKFVIFLVVAVVATTFPLAMLTAQTPARVSLQEQLLAQYKLAKMGFDSNGTTVVEPGTLLAVQKVGILSVPWTALTSCPAKFQENTLHSPSGLCAGMMQSVSKYLKAGDKVYPIKVNVNMDREKIVVTVVACDSCNGTNPPTSFKGEVVFQFGKGYLEKADAAAVEDTIGQVFAISSSESQQMAQAAQEDQGQPAAEEQPQADPQTIQLGQTSDQVQTALGKPEKIVNLGAKQILVYKDLKVTFLNGKVTDVQ